MTLIWPVGLDATAWDLIVPVSFQHSLTALETALGIRDPVLVRIGTLFPRTRSAKSCGWWSFNQSARTGNRMNSGC